MFQWVKEAGTIQLPPAQQPSQPAVIDSLIGEFSPATVSPAVSLDKRLAGFQLAPPPVQAHISPSQTYFRWRRWGEVRWGLTTSLLRSQVTSVFAPAREGESNAVLTLRVFVRLTQTELGTKVWPHWSPLTRAHWLEPTELGSNKAHYYSPLEPTGENPGSLCLCDRVTWSNSGAVEPWQPGSSPTSLPAPRRQICQRRQAGCQDPEPPHEVIISPRSEVRSQPSQYINGEGADTYSDHLCCPLPVLALISSL